MKFGLIWSCSSSQFFEENPILPLGKCPVHESWIAGCPPNRLPGALGDESDYNGRAIYERIGFRGRICSGVIYGDFNSFRLFLNGLGEILDGGYSCSRGGADQGLVNAVVWDHRLRHLVNSRGPAPSQRGLEPDRVKFVVWKNFWGPLKTVDVGGWLDEGGYFLNHQGRRWGEEGNASGIVSPSFSWNFRFYVSQLLPDTSIQGRPQS